MDLLWSDGDLTVAGPDTHAHIATDFDGLRITAVRFAPGIAPGFFGLPAHLLRDQRVPLAAIWPRADVERLAASLADSDRPGTMLEEVATSRLTGTGPQDPALEQVAGAARRGEPVAVTAVRLGLSERQLHRRCLAAFGYGAKQLHRILRMNRALDLARSGVSLADTAVRAGYTDQAQLSRDVRALAGVSMSALIR